MQKKKKNGNVLKIMHTEMSGGAIPLHTTLYMTLNLADLGSH